MKVWKEYIESIAEIDGYKNRIRSYISDRDAMLNKGGQKNSAPFTQKMGKHVTFDKQLEEEVESDSFQMHDTLEPRLWEEKHLDPEIRKALLRVARDFVDNLPVDVKIKDITLTGSLANFNWSSYSDVDLHIIVDFLEVDENVELVKAFFDVARWKWNESHQISMKGYDVEIYVEDEGESHKSSGVYSILNDEWIEEPQQSDPSIDFEGARRKADDVEFQVNAVSNLISAGSYKKALRSIERLKLKIRNMRRAGLDSPQQEFSLENIAFKILRRNDTLQFLNQMKKDAYDKMVQIDGEEDEIYTNR